MTARNVLVAGAGAAGTGTAILLAEADLDVDLDHLPHVSAFIADWVTDTFAQLPPPGG
jgi:flavin-dependent dehydrogenase